MSAPPSKSVPARPPAFTTDWAVFCEAAVNAIVQNRKSGESLASALLAGGAVLGAAGMVALLLKNRDAINERGKEWGLDGLDSLVAGTGTALGAAMGGLGGVFLTRLLGRHAKDESVDALQGRLAEARREFEELRRERAHGGLSAEQHRVAVEDLFARVTRG